MKEKMKENKMMEGMESAGVEKKEPVEGKESKKHIKALALKAKSKMKCKECGKSKDKCNC